MTRAEDETGPFEIKRPELSPERELSLALMEALQRGQGMNDFLHRFLTAEGAAKRYTVLTNPRPLLAAIISTILREKKRPSSALWPMPAAMALPRR